MVPTIIVVVLVIFLLPAWHFMSKLNAVSERLTVLEAEVASWREKAAIAADVLHSPTIPEQEGLHMPRPQPAFAGNPAPPVAAATIVEDVVADAIPGLGVAASARATARDVLHARPRRPSALNRWLTWLESSDDWEAVVGGRWLNRIGALALILGIGFFLKYAFHQNWINHSLRIAVGFTVGAGLLALAARAHAKSYAIFAQGLVGAGTASLYLTVYAAYEFYSLLPALGALVAIALVTGLAFAQAMYYDSLAVSVLAWIGGFLAPLLLALQHPNEPGLFVYLIVLDAGILAITFRRPDWSVLEPLTLAATWGITGAWYANAYGSSHLLMTVVFITILWALFFALEIGRVFRPLPISARATHVLWTVNGATYYGALLILISPSHHGLLGPTTLALGAGYLAALLAMRTRGLPLSTSARYAVTAIGLLVLATIFRFAGFIAVALLALEALGLSYLGVRTALKYVWRPGLVVYGVATGLLMATPGALAYEPVHAFLPVFNLRALAFAVLAAAVVAAVPLFERLRDPAAENVRTSLHYGWCVLTFLVLTAETNDVFRHLLTGASPDAVTHLDFLRSLAVATVWMAYSLPLAWAGLRSRLTPLLVSGLASSALAIVLEGAIGLTYRPLHLYRPILNVRTGVFILLIAALLVHFQWWRGASRETPWREPVSMALRCAGLLLGFELLTAETNDFFQHVTGYSTIRGTGRGPFIESVTLAMEWMLYSLLPVWYGIKRHSMPVLTLGVGAACVAVGAGALAGVAWEPPGSLGLLFVTARPLTFAIIAGSLFAQMRWMRAGQGFRWGGTALVIAQAAVVLLGLELVGTEVRDVFIASSPGSHDLEQLLLSVFWLAYAILLIVIGIFTRTRWVRMAAMGLFAFVIVKIFAYDLGFLAPAYRSISLAGLGVVLLGVSFLYQRFRGMLLEAA
ncbi:MAG: DUF2339 domain-containing protein [Chloroflexota bacterium]